MDKPARPPPSPPGAPDDDACTRRPISYQSRLTTYDNITGRAAVNNHDARCSIIYSFRIAYENVKTFYGIGVKFLIFI